MYGGSMKKRFALWGLWGFAVTSLLGTLLHYLYDWLKESVWVAPFSGVNESTWEHMKLLFWPMLGFAVLESFFFRDREDFWCVKLRGILSGLLLIPLLFYLYNGVIGKSPDFVNITIFFISAALAFLYEVRLFAIDKPSCKSQRRTFFAICAIALLFVIFTFRTPHLAIFRDPITGAYGI